MKKITVIGAGIGGLTFAIALKQQGVEVEIFESTPEFKEAGAGINLAINAMQVFQRLGIYNEILNSANYIQSMNLRTKKLEYLSKGDLKKSEKEFSAKAVAIHRATLQAILLQHLDGVKIHLDKRMKSLVQKDGKVEIKFEDGTSHTAEIVIGADGIQSATRKSIFRNTELRDAKQVCWRGISSTKTPPENLRELNEMWGKGKRFGFVHIKQSEVYWYALIDKDKFKNKTENLSVLFSDFHQIVHEILEGTPDGKIICNEIWDLKPLKNWYKGSVCLLGDSVHATTPNLGQGACQAIESAMALSICLAEETEIEKAFKRYELIRSHKANQVAKTSWTVGKMSHLKNPIAIAFRDFFIKNTPSFLLEKQNRTLFKLNF